MNTFDLEKFKKDHGIVGPVTDKEEAIWLLCETNRAWEVLSEDLKRDPDVIMFFQPSGELIISEDGYGDRYPSRVFGFFGDEELFTTVKIKIEEEFHWSSQIESIHALGGYKVSRGFIPFCEIPEGFDWDKYFQIQSEMKEKTRKATSEERILCGDFNNVIDEYTIDNNTLFDKFLSDDVDGLYIYDREVLKKYASELLGTKKL